MILNQLEYKKAVISVIQVSVPGFCGVFSHAIRVSTEFIIKVSLEPPTSCLRVRVLAQRQRDTSNRTSISINPIYASVIYHILQNSTKIVNNWTYG